jgi:quercetin dioxygenase-like cupin family protein
MAERVTSGRGSDDSSEPVCALLPAVEDSALALDVVRIDSGRRLAFFDRPSDRDLLLYAFTGPGSLTIGNETHELPPQAAALALAGEDVSLEAGPGGLAAICASVGPSVDRHAPMGPREPVVRLQDADSGRATGARSFEVLLGPHNGSTRATLFVGHLPPGKAPWHYHLYDEIVWIPDGPGQLHVGDTVEELGAGSAFRLRPREVHIVENASEEQAMSLVGIFTPAGSPSAAYLTAEVAAEYRFAD